MPEQSPVNVDPTLSFWNLARKEVRIPPGLQTCLVKGSYATRIHKLTFVIIAASSGPVEEDEKRVLLSFFHFGG